MATVPDDSSRASILPLPGSVISEIMPKAPSKYFNPLNSAMAKYDIVSRKRISGFFAQLAVESNELNRNHELWTSRTGFKLAGVNRDAYTATTKEDYFNYWYGDRADLGNDQESDGYRYRGRGAIQITGRANYKAVGDGIGVSLVDDPDLLETNDAVNVLAAAYFFGELKQLNVVADAVNTTFESSIVDVNKKLTKRVNGGTNAIDERLKYYRKALKSLKA